MAPKTQAPLSGPRQSEASVFDHRAEVERFKRLAPGWLASLGAFIDNAYCGTVVLQKEKEPDICFSWGLGQQPSMDFFRLSLDHAKRTAKGIILTLPDKRDTSAAGKKKTEPAESLPQTTHICFPLSLTDHIQLTACFEIYPESRIKLQRAMDQLQWSLSWFGSSLLNSGEAAEDPHKYCLNQAANLLHLVLHSPNTASAAKSLAREFARLCGAERAAIGLVKNGRLKIVGCTLTQDNSVYLKYVTAAQEEALEQACPITIPPDPNTRLSVSTKHRLLMEKFNNGSVGTYPFPTAPNSPPLATSGQNQDCASTFEGAITFEWDSDEKGASSRMQCSQLVNLIGPVLYSMAFCDQPLHKLMAGRISRIAGYYGLYSGWSKKFALAAVALLIAALFIVRGQLIITAEASLSGTVQRVVVAPYSGFIAESSKRAGDTTHQGELLALLDTSDIALDQVSWTSKKNQATLEYGRAIAKTGNADAQIVQEQIKQAKIQLSLLELKKERARITAPFAGIIVRGDLTQSIGGPVERGQVLFEIVPQDSFRIIGLVDEGDIAFIEVGQRGALVLNSLPNRSYDFSVSKVTPVSEAGEGSNRFRVEGELVAGQNDLQRLKPGMNGYARIATGKKNLLWIWTRKLRDQLQIWYWLLLG